MRHTPYLGMYHRRGMDRQIPAVTLVLVALALTLEYRSRNHHSLVTPHHRTFTVLRLLRLWRLAAHDLRLLWFALRHPHRPLWLLPAAILLAFYALEPFNFVVPAIGVVDDFIVLPLILRVLVQFLPLEIRAGYGLRSARGR
jgi:uncharacterized membrane protein YkvA (DUF1232 family)